MFSALAVDHINCPRSVGPLGGATHHGVAGVPGDGPFVEIWFRIRDELIEDGAYRTYGCPTSIACSSIAVQILTGRSLEKARQLNHEDLVALIGTVPEGKEDCPPRVISAIQEALKD